MLVKMLKGKDLYYPGELVDLPTHVAQTYISAGVAEPAVCPECGGQILDAGSAWYCRNCGYRRWK